MAMDPSVKIYWNFDSNNRGKKVEITLNGVAVLFKVWLAAADEEMHHTCLILRKKGVHIILSAIY